MEIYKITVKYHEADAAREDELLVAGENYTAVINKVLSLYGCGALDEIRSRLISNKQGDGISIISSRSI